MKPMQTNWNGTPGQLHIPLCQDAKELVVIITPREYVRGRTLRPRIHGTYVNRFIVDEGAVIKVI